MPGPEILDRPAPPADLRLSYGTCASQFVDFRFPSGDGPFPLVVHIHGGFWRNRRDLGHAGHLCAALTAEGTITANVEYRRVGDEGGGWPGTCEDVAAALQFARRRGAAFRHDRRTIVSGHSAGGHLALLQVATGPPGDVAVAIAPVAHLQRAYELDLGNGAVKDFLGGTPDDVSGRFAAACPARLPSRTIRVLVHGTNDDIVPLSVSRAFMAARSGEPVELVEVANSDHFDVIDPESVAWNQVLSAYRRALTQCTAAPK